ncbi:MAG: hypothetical protein KU38_11190 [Sulfurovum sp. FS08-3]|nr:MAG: hypothetical protein KU38_11190 [Sulfurovum sp. FS08-3]
MHTFQLNIDDGVINRFMNFIDTLPAQSISIEAMDSVPYYPAISFEEAREKVAKSIANIPQNQGIESQEFFDTLLDR